MIMRAAASLLVTMFVAALPRIAFAQTTAVELPREIRSVVIQELVLPTLADPSGGRDAIKPEFSATIVTGSGGARGQFKAGFEVPQTKLVDFLNFTLSTPARDGRAQLVLGDEIPSGTKVEVSGSRLLLFATRVDPAGVGEAIDVNPSGTPAERLNEFVRRFAANALKRSTGLLLTAGAEYGRETFTFRLTPDGPDEPGLLRETTVGSFGGGLVMYFEGSVTPVYVGATYRASRGWKAKPTMNLCASVDDGSLIRCNNVVVGTPDEVRKESLSFELRARTGTHFGVVPQMSIDLSDAAKGKRFSAEFPVYLVTDAAKEPKLSGGLAIGYRQDGGAYAVVFVGPTFPVLPDRSAQKLTQLRTAAAAIR